MRPHPGWAIWQAGGNNPERIPSVFPSGKDWDRCLVERRETGECHMTDLRLRTTKQDAMIALGIRRKNG